MTSTSGSAITARDFNRNTQDPRRDEWTPGAMHHLVKALNGTAVAIVCEKNTGFAEVNVTLGGVRENGYGHYEVLVNRVYSDGTTGGCWYLLFKIGAVITLDSRADQVGLGARYEAVKTLGEERRQGIRKLQDHMMAQLGVEDREQLPRGKWECSSFPRHVHASFTPESYTGPVKFTWQAYHSADLVPAE